MKLISCNIIDNQVKINDELIYSSKEHLIESFLKELYYKFEIKYPKFFKMDNLCKIGIIGTELIHRKSKSILNQKNKIGIILQNRSSSLDSDLKHQEGIDNNDVSPAVFVYTLPNIVIGEISIKQNWQSEGVFFIDNQIDCELLSQYSNILLKEKRTVINLVGWIDVLKNKSSLKLCLIDRQITTEDLESLMH